MASLTELLAQYTDLPGTDATQLQRLVAEWQLLADLSFADLRLWVPVNGDLDSLTCIAQCRPNTAPTVYAADGVGLPPADPTGLVGAFRSGVTSRPAVRLWLGEPGLFIVREAVPVRSQAGVGARHGADGVIAVMTRDTAAAPRFGHHSNLEVSYRQSADDICEMIADGSFPLPDDGPLGQSTPRAGDGFLRLDPAGRIGYASPNAQSALRRMGSVEDVTGRAFAEIVTELVDDGLVVEEEVAAIAAVLAGGTLRTELNARSATVVVRAFGLRPGGRAVGAVVLLRDVTDLKRRDRALISKDATIREIHHRVKNNLQSVSALLRLQARRTTNDEAKQALQESVRRVASIALVHETLSMSVDEMVDVDGVIEQLLPMMTDVSPVRSPVRVVRSGQVGHLDADRAMPLVMVVTELIQNAIEHAFEPDRGGRVEVIGSRSTRLLTVSVRDDGRGLPEDFDLARSDRLGLQIVGTLVSTELGGQLEMRGDPETGGTIAILTMPLSG